MNNAYTKPSLSPAHLLELLIQHGLTVHDAAKAIKQLKMVSYHRLSSYFEPFLLPNTHKQQFKAGSSFEGIWELYSFDRKLRLLLSDALERIEVAFRTTISDNMSCLYGSHWFLERIHFKNTYLYGALLKQIDALCQNSHEPSIRGYYKKYQYPLYPPSWMVIECLSFGACCSTFSNLKRLGDKKVISEIFGYHPTAIESWMDALRYTRNLCAHHARVWNRWFVVSPKLTYLYGPSFQKENSFYAQALVIKKLLTKINSYKDWQQQLSALFQVSPAIDMTQMGFQADWQNDAFWELT